MANGKSLDEILNNLGIDIKTLSDNESKYVKQIYELFIKFETDYNDLSKKINSLKFNKSYIANNVDCSRQALYDNPTLMILIDWCLNKVDILTNKVNDRDLVSRSKYNILKEENEKLLVNIIDVNEKDIEIERLQNELKRQKEINNELIVKLNKLSKNNRAC